MKLAARRSPPSPRSRRPPATSRRSSATDGGFGDAAAHRLGDARARRAPARTRRAAAEYLARSRSRPTATDLALVAMARAAARRPARRPARRASAAYRPGKLVNATIWTSSRSARQVSRRRRALVQALLRPSARPAAGRGSPAAPPTRTTRPPRCRRSVRPACAGGRSTAASSSFAATRTADGGFELTQGRGSDTQSTAWAIQALVAAGASPARRAFRYLPRMRRPDGSYRYNARYVTTPLWVTAQALPALARKPFPLATG